MHAPHKAEQLNIRASAQQKAKLAEAARLKHMNLSQFVLAKSLEAAEEVLADRMTILLTAEDYDRFVAKLESPPTDVPELRQLLQAKSVFDQ